MPERSSKLDPFVERLTAWLRREMGRSRKQKRTVKQLYADLVSLGFDGSYGRVAAFARAWRDDYRRQQQMSGKGTFVPLSFAPGVLQTNDRPTKLARALQELDRLIKSLYMLRFQAHQYARALRLYHPRHGRARRTSAAPRSQRTGIDDP